MRYYQIIRESDTTKTPVDNFLDEVWETTAPHPFDRRSRIVNGNATIEVRPDIDDRANAVHISDILSLDAGKRLGYGRDALGFLLALADKHHVSLTLTAKAYAKGPGSQNFPKTKALVDWYTHYGFKRRHGQMERRPNTPIPPPRQPLGEARGGYSSEQAKEIGDCAVIAMSAITGVPSEQVFAVTQPYFTRTGVNENGMSRVMRKLGWDVEQSYWKLLGLSGKPMTVRAAEAYLKQNDPDIRLLCTIKLNGVLHAVAFVDGEFKNVQDAYRARIRSANICTQVA